MGTINPDSGTYPFISVSRVYSPEGIRQLRGILKRSAMFEENQLSEVISLGHIYIRTEAEFKDQIIDEAVGHMAEEGLVRQEFLLSVYKREGMMTTRLSQDRHSPWRPGLNCKTSHFCYKIRQTRFMGWSQHRGCYFCAGHSGGFQKIF